ncbi:hypothetical protein PROFUN_00448 [Planoprotostelium fungivorum]|uniref:Rhamnogalacturonase A/B/Epimerase-like pectate lyase domain-containing protein n=1 Tax=Planoprotostelium fungivorum TaxID=1890364 RepID=A0A2P6N0U5_9EUKA|nr:hypothetical protein PROFUN_00448 [Planoprotostelium fungivorum]
MKLPNTWIVYTVFLLVGISSSLADCPAYTSTGGAPFWLGRKQHTSLSAFQNGTYQVFRNVMDYGAKGDGVADDTEPIRRAIADGRCGPNCDSSTTRYAVIYFPSGVYRVRSTIPLYFMTLMVGDANDVPTIRASPDFIGDRIIEANTDTNGGNWFRIQVSENPQVTTHSTQNNFHQQMRNLKIDTTAVPAQIPITAIRWMVAQGSSLFKIQIELSSQPGTQHRGILCESGSASYFGDVTVSGGDTGVIIGNQQFNIKGLTIRNTRVALRILWGWGWVFHQLSVYNSTRGLDISGMNGQQPSVSSMAVVDSQFDQVTEAIVTVAGHGTADVTLTLDHVKFHRVDRAVVDTAGTVLLSGSMETLTIDIFLTGRIYNSPTQGFDYRGLTKRMERPTTLTDKNDLYIVRPRPQYEGANLDDVIDVRAMGARGDGNQDDTAALQLAIDSAGCRIVFLPAGTYRLTRTLFVPAGTRMVGEAWSQLMAHGPSFSDPAHPEPMIQVGLPGDVGSVELSELMFTAAGPAQGAILVQWNIRDSPNSPASAGMWDCHFRIGGAVGTYQQIEQCPASAANVIPECLGVFMMMHVTASASIYMENVWGWTADRDMDSPGQPHISVYNGRGLLMESRQASWLYGTSFEHSINFQYNFYNASNIFVSMLQTETPYYQPNVPAPLNSFLGTHYSDPDFSNCQSKTCMMSQALRIFNSEDIIISGANMYSFFNGYDQACLSTSSCQDAVFFHESPRSGVYVYNLITLGTSSMAEFGTQEIIPQADNKNGFTSSCHYLFTA